MVIPQIPYAAIGEFIAIILAIVAFISAGDKGRIFLIVSFLLTICIQNLFPSRPISLICHLARLMIGIGSFIYLKLQGAIGSR